MIPILRASDAGELKRRVMNRSQLQNEEVSRIVKEIVARVRQEGDAALFDYTAKFDHVKRPLCPCVRVAERVILEDKGPEIYERETSSVYDRPLWH